MSPLRWILLATGAAAAVLFVVWWYRYREEPVAGRGWAAALRSSGLVLLWLLLLNPPVAAWLRAGSGREIAMLDASFSMTRAAGPAEISVWSMAVDSVRRFGDVWLFGGPFPRLVRTDSLPPTPPFYESRLAPALRAAALAGARRLVVFTDGGISDGAEAREEVRRTGIRLTLVRLGAAFRSVGIAELTPSAWAQAGDTAEVRIAVVAGSAASGDSVRAQVVDEEGRVRAAAWIPLPAAGRFSAARLVFPVGGRAGYRRFRARLADQGADGEARDDERPFYVHVTERPVGPVLISLEPDWEPSFLLTNLDRLTDARSAAYLWLADSIVTLDGYRPVSLSTVQRRARAAPLLVLHGLDAASPAWALDLVRRARRLLVLPSGSRGFDLPGWGVQIGAPVAGEWYVSRDVPSSPLALALSGFPLADLAPLLHLRSIEADASWAPLRVQRTRRGAAAPALAAGSAGGRRWAVAAAEGYWRWAFRPGAGRDLYRAFWTEVGAWLLQSRAGAGLALAPLSTVVTRDQPLVWNAVLEADSTAVDISAGDSSFHFAVAGGSDSLVARLPPGRYRFLARAYRSGRIAASAEGPAEVEPFTPELLPRSGSVLEGPLAPPEGASAEAHRQGSRRLATLGWPYLLLILLFCAEWAVRRYIGLR